MSLSNLFGSPVFYALLGSVIGAFFTFLFQNILKTKEMTLRLREKNFDKKYQAHHGVLKSLKAFQREDFHFRYVNKDGGALFYPKVFEDAKSFDSAFKQLQETWYDHEYLFTVDVWEAFYRVEQYLHHMNRCIKEGGYNFLPLFGYWIEDELFDYTEDCVEILEHHLENMAKRPKRKARLAPLPEEKINYEMIVKRSKTENNHDEFLEILARNKDIITAELGPQFNQDGQSL